MDNKIKMMDDTEIEVCKFHQNKSPISINDIGINKRVVCNKRPLGKLDFKYFICYKDSEKIRPLCIFHPQMIYVKEILTQVDVFIF